MPMRLPGNSSISELFRAKMLDSLAAGVGTLAAFFKVSEVPVAALRTNAL